MEALQVGSYNLDLALKLIIEIVSRLTCKVWNSDSVPGQTGIYLFKRYKFRSFHYIILSLSSQKLHGNVQVSRYNLDLAFKLNVEIVSRIACKA